MPQAVADCKPKLGSVLTLHLRYFLIKRSTEGLKV